VILSLVTTRIHIEWHNRITFINYESRQEIPASTSFSSYTSQIYSNVCCDEQNSLSKRIIYENDSCIIYVHTCIILHNVYIYVSTSLKRLHRRIEAIKGRKKNNSKTSSWFMSYTCALRPTDCLANQLILFSSHSRFPLSKRPSYVEQTYLQRNVPYIGHVVLHMFISIVSPSGKRTIILIIRLSHSSSLSNPQRSFWGGRRTPEWRESGSSQMRLMAHSG